MMEIGLYVLSAVIAVTCYLWGRRDERREWRRRLAELSPTWRRRLFPDDEQERERRGGE